MKPEPFAKIFDHPEYGQVLVQIMDGETGPMMNITVDMEQFGLGLCSAGITKETDTPEEWEKVYSVFREMNQEKTFAFVEGIVGAAKEMSPQNNEPEEEDNE